MYYNRYESDLTSITHMYAWRGDDFDRLRAESEDFHELLCEEGELLHEALEEIESKLNECFWAHEDMPQYVRAAVYRTVCAYLGGVTSSYHPDFWAVTEPSAT